MRNTILFVLVAATLESGCGAKLPSMKPYKMDIQQGNVVTSKMLLQLRPGMTRSQVRYIMGTPLVVDSFHDNRWDYFFELRKQGQVVEKRRVILDFDNDSLVSVRGDVIPSADNPDVKTVVDTPATQSSSESPSAENDESWTDKLKFWKSDEAKSAANVANLAPEAAKPAAAAKAGSVTATNQAALVSPAQPSANTAAPASQDEIVPYIPEGEYVADPAKAAGQTTGSPQSTAANASEPASVVETVAGVTAATAVAADQASTAKEISTKSSHTENVKKGTDVPSKDVKAASATKPVVEEDEVVPYIPEGEYVAPVVPTPEEMVKGNASHTNEPVMDASTSSVTEKGVAPESMKEAAEAPPVFIPEQMPDTVTEPEPELTPPSTQSLTAAQTDQSPVQAPAPKAEQPSIADSISSGISDQPTAVAAPLVMPESATVSVDNTDIDQAVNRWARAWREKDLTAYFAAYSPKFVPDSSITKSVWESQRKQRLSAKQGAITLVLSHIQIKRDDNHAVVQFDQKYAAKSYSDNTVKILEMEYASDQNTWLITRERSGKNPPAVLAMGSQTTAPVVAASKPEGNPDAGQSPASTLPSVDVAIQGWAEAWRNKNVKDYLDAYAPDFMPEGQLSRKAWEAQRKQRLSSKQGTITLELSDLNVQQDGHDAVAHFKQKYAAKAYSDEMMKELQLHFDSSRNAWLITRETQFKGKSISSTKQDPSTQEEVPVEPTGF